MCWLRCALLLCFVFYASPALAEEQLRSICLNASSMKKYLDAYRGAGTERQGRFMKPANRGVREPQCFLGEAQVIDSEHIASHWANGKSYEIWLLYVRRTYTNGASRFHAVPLAVYVAILSKAGVEI